MTPPPDADEVDVLASTDEVRVRKIEWEDASAVPITLAQWFSAHRDMDGIHLVVGQTNVPVFSGSREERIAAIAGLASVPVKPVVRLQLSLLRAQQLREVLDRILDAKEEPNA
jgi:hypothetical protein